MARQAVVERRTRETDIAVTLELDGAGRADIDTGIGFFDHMLEGFARHGLFDLTVRCKGDLQVDSHHTIEDTGIALGTALLQALGDKAGIVRYGSCLLPMDETLALCAVDLGGRPYCVYDAAFAAPACGGMDTQMAREFFYGQLCRRHEPAPEGFVRRKRPPQAGGHVQGVRQSAERRRAPR